MRARAARPISDPFARARGLPKPVRQDQRNHPSGPRGDLVVARGERGGEALFHHADAFEWPARSLPPSVATAKQRFGQERLVADCAHLADEVVRQRLRIRATTGAPNRFEVASWLRSASTRARVASSAGGLITARSSATSAHRSSRASEPALVTAFSTTLASARS